MTESAWEVWVSEVLSVVGDVGSSGWAVILAALVMALPLLGLGAAAAARRSIPVVAWLAALCPVLVVGSAGMAWGVSEATDVSWAAPPEMLHSLIASSLSAATLSLLWASRVCALLAGLAALATAIGAWARPGETRSPSVVLGVVVSVIALVAVGLFGTSGLQMAVTALPAGLALGLAALRSEEEGGERSEQVAIRARVAALAGTDPAVGRSRHVARHRDDRRHRPAGGVRPALRPGGAAVRRGP